MLPLLLAALAIVPEESALEAPPPPPPKQFSVYREVVLLSGVTLSAAGTGVAAYAIWKEKDWAAITASSLIGAGTIFSLGTMFGSHRYEPPPSWVFVVGPIIGLFAGAVAAIATSDFLR